MTNKTLPPMHPGEVLREEFLVPMQMTSSALAKALGVPRTRIERIADETVSITADTALRLSKFFGTSAEFWLNMQSRYDVQIAEKAIRTALKRIKRIETAESQAS